MSGLFSRTGGTLVWRCQLPMMRLPRCLMLCSHRYLSFCLPTCPRPPAPSVCPSIRLCLSVCFCLYICRLPLSLSVSMPVCLYRRIRVCLSCVCLPVCHARLSFCYVSTITIRHRCTITIKWYFVINIVCQLLFFSLEGTIGYLSKI